MNASCENTAKYEKVIPIQFGSVNRQNLQLQPVGSLLASLYVQPTDYGLIGDTVLWACAKEDREHLYFLVATNGNHLHGGYLESGRRDERVYATWFQGVGLRQRIGDVTLSRRWQKVPLGQVPVNPATGMLEIRLKDLPYLYAELYRTQSRIPRAPGVNACSDKGTPSGAGNDYDCTAPNSYIQLVGPGLLHDQVDTDSRSHRVGISADNGFGYSLHRAAKLRAIASCVVRSPDLHVRFPTISVRDLEAGRTAMESFSLEFECHENARSGLLNSTFFSLQASPGAFAAAQRLNLVNGDGGVRFLVSDHYGNDQNLAKGVGIALYGGNPEKSRRYFASPFNRGNNLPKDAGWHLFFENARRIPPAEDDLHWTLEFDAELTRLPDQDVIPGKIHAIAHVQVKVP